MNPQLWNSWLPTVAMPKGTTYEEFWEVRKRLVLDPELDRLDRQLELEGENGKNI